MRARNKGRGRGVTAAAQANHAPPEAWLVRYDAKGRKDALAKLRKLGEGTELVEVTQGFLEALRNAAARFVPFRRPGRTVQP